MKTPITYYGGKQSMLNIILPLIPEHEIYCEPFFGGGAVFFAKGPASVEVINDTNHEVVNFYSVVKTKLAKLQALINRTLHSRDAHRHAKVIYNNADMFTDVQRAWAFYTLANQSYSSDLSAGWTYDNKQNKVPRRIAAKNKNFTDEYAERLSNTQIECDDAINVINCRDSADTFFYIDPPYFQVHQGHYNGYKLADFELLLQTLSSIKGKFLLSSYPGESLSQYVAANGWLSEHHNGHIQIGAREGKTKKKTEVLTRNYII